MDIKIIDAIAANNIFWTIKNSNVTNFFILLAWIIFDKAIQGFLEYITYHLFIELIDANAREMFPRIVA